MYNYTKAEEKRLDQEGQRLVEAFLADPREDLLWDEYLAENASDEYKQYLKDFAEESARNLAKGIYINYG